MVKETKKKKLSEKLWEQLQPRPQGPLLDDYKNG